MSYEQIAEAVGIVAAIAVMLLAIGAIAACEYFKPTGLPDDDGDA